MKSVHLVIPDLFLPRDIAAEICAGLRLPALEKLLARGHTELLPALPLENLLCEMFGAACAEDAPVAPISAAFDGLAAGYWLRADPVHLSLQRDRLMLAGVQTSSEEAAQFCASLNKHFAGQGMEFFAPHPQRWYVRLDALPRIRTTPLSEVLGCNVRGALPTGVDAPYWHQLFNEIQMLLFAHPLNQTREASGELPVNSVWLWGAGGPADALQKADEHLLSGHPYDSASSDHQLVEMFAAAAKVPFAGWPARWRDEPGDGRQLLVWTGLRTALQRGDLASWRAALQDFETGYALPIWQALRAGRIVQLQLDIPGADGIRRMHLRRSAAWAVWRRGRSLAEYSGA